MSLVANHLGDSVEPSGKFSLYPWLKQVYSKFVQNGIPNSLLIYGEKDIGKLNLGIHLANYLICENKNNGSPCLVCNACNWFQKGNHPDFFAILPEDSYDLLPFEIDTENLPTKSSEDKKQSKFIRIDQVRDILTVNELSSYRGGRRVILIYPVESMRIEAANCLLKSLEEPADDVFYILITHRLDGVLPTIRSRCRLLAVPRPSKEASIEWLSNHPHFANKSLGDLHALFHEMGRSPLKVIHADSKKLIQLRQMLDYLCQSHRPNSEQFVDLLNHCELSELLSFLQKWCIDLFMVNAGLTPRYFPDKYAELKSHVSKVNVTKLDRFLTLLIQELKLATHPLFPKVQFEAILSKYSQIFI